MGGGQRTAQLVLCYLQIPSLDEHAEDERYVAQLDKLYAIVMVMMLMMIFHFSVCRNGEGVQVLPSL